MSQPQNTQHADPSRGVLGSESQPSGSSSASYTSTTDSSTTVHDADEERILQLTWTDVLGTILADVPCEPEPVCVSHGKPVLAIQYSPSFAFVLGFYRALRPSMMALVRSSKAQICAAAYGPNAGFSGLSKWFLLTGFTIRQCSSHYTVWSDRRELVLSPQAFWAATHERLPVPSVWLATGTANAGPQGGAGHDEEAAHNAFRFSEVTQTWLPSLTELPADAADALTKSAGHSGTATLSSATREEARLEVKALLHAVAWELAATARIGRMYHKNFQVWHHRKETLQYALERMVDVRLLLGQDTKAAATADLATRNAAKADLLSTLQGFTQELHEQYDVTFAQLDERIISSEVLETVDSKNYHVWSHRSSFVHLFEFLVQGPPATSWRSDWLTFCGNDDVDCEAPFQVDKDWLDVHACIDTAPVPPSAAITREFDFTARAINADCFNNSAWCHRSLLFRVDVVGALLNRYATTQPAASEEYLSLAELLRVLKYLCKREVDFALQWAYLRPSNECAFVYARSVGEVYQSATLRLKLHAAMMAAGATGSEGGSSVAVAACRVPLQLLTTTTNAPLTGPVAAVSMGFIARPATAAAADPQPERTADVINDDDAVAHCLLSMKQYLPWQEYVDTFLLLHYQQDVMSRFIVPEVARYSDEIHSALRQLAETSSTDPAEQGTKRQKVLGKLYLGGSQFMLDNLHQVHAALFHSNYLFLEQTWLLYWKAEQRKALAAARPPADYARAGVTEEMLPRDRWCQRVSRVRSLTETDWFLQTEAMALSLGKRLTVEDPVRVKYWKHEVRTVMQREY